MFEKKLPRVAIIAGVRTPFAKAGTLLKDYSALALGAHAVRGLLEKTYLDPKKIEELVFGIVIQDSKVSNIAREIVFMQDLPRTLPAYTVTNNCITGMEAITAIHDAIVTQRIKVGVAGGTESMSNIPLVFPAAMSRFMFDLQKQKTLANRFKQLLKIKPSYFKPQMPSISEPSTGLTMGEYCELMAKEWHVTRTAQDEIAYHSHMHADEATQMGLLRSEIYPLAGVDSDNIIRADTTLEKLAKLPTVFDRSPAGTITAGNSSPLTDGASAVLLASEEYAEKMGWKPLAYIKAFEYTAVDPKDGLLMAPGTAVPRVLRNAGLKLADMGIVEMHEAFAAQIICNLMAWESGWHEAAIGTVPFEKLNPLGGSIAIGHPFSATGGRIVTTLANELKRRNLHYGLISICAAGAMASAMILERA